MRRRFLLIVLIGLVALEAAKAQSAGTVARAGFGARGLAVGNALAGDASGLTSPWYNPALAPYVRGQNLNLSAALLTHDRQLQFVELGTPLRPRAGIAAVTSHEGPEKNTLQYARDGLNFEVVGKLSVPPVAAGPHVPDAFSDSGDGRGVTWGLAHVQHGHDGPLANGYLVRFDCNLSRDVQRAGFYRAWNYRFPESAYFSKDFRLTDDDQAEARQLMSRIDEDTKLPG